MPDEAETNRTAPGPTRSFRCWLGAMLALATLPVFAHGDIHAQIAELDRQIAARPADPALYRRRAELHRVHREWAAAEHDYAMARTLAPDGAEFDWLRARNALEAGKPQRALNLLDPFLHERPGHHPARLTRARALVASGQPASALGDFDLALRGLDPPEPDHFLERLDAQTRSGATVSMRLAGLAEGTARLGPIPQLENAALDLEAADGRWGAALARIDRLAAASPRQERWAFRRGEILARAGRNDEAREAFRTARAAISRLPEAVRRQRATAELTRDIDDAIARLGQGNRPSGMPGSSGL